MNSSLGHAIDPENAIWNKDPIELRRALDAGWMPYARVKEGSVPDLMFVIRIISLRWTEGWELISSFQPDLKTNPLLWQLAIRRGVHGIVQDMINSGMPANGALESGLLPLHVLAEALGNQPGEPVEESDMVETAHVLIRAGANPLEPYPGKIVPGGISPKGHTLWTRSVYFRCWEMATAFLPAHWDEILGSPRGLEAVEELRQEAQRGDKGAVRLWGALFLAFGKNLLTAYPEESFVSPVDLTALLGLPVEEQALFWKRWERVDAAGWTGLHDLALSGADPVAHSTLALLVKEQNPVLRLWEREDEQGLRPCDFWEMANNRARAGSSPPLPSQVPELLR